MKTDPRDLILDPTPIDELVIKLSNIKPIFIDEENSGGLPMILAEEIIAKQHVCSYCYQVCGNADHLYCHIQTKHPKDENGQRI